MGDLGDRSTVFSELTPVPLSALQRGSVTHYILMTFNLFTGTTVKKLPGGQF